METKTLKTVKIFVASAGELSQDRVEFGNFINKLRAHYKARGFDFDPIEWEYLENDDHTHRKQDEYNEHIKNCDVFVSLFYTRAGHFTIEEYKIALEQNKKRNLPMLTFTRKLENGKKADDSLVNFRKEYCDQYYWGEYGNNDKLHLDFAMWLDSYLFDGKSEFMTVNGNVVLGDVIIAKLKQLPFAANNEDFKRLSKTIQEYPEKIEKLRKRTEKFPDEQEFRDELQQVLNDYNRAVEEFARYQQTLLDTAKFIAERRQEQTDDKLKRAVDAFEVGDMAGANAILNEIDIEADEFNKHFERDRCQMHKYIEAFQLQTKTVMAKVETPIEDRIVRVAELYAKADDRADSSNYDKKKYASLLFDYAKFLTEFARYPEAEQVFIRQIKMSEELYGTESAETATSYNEFGLFYMVQEDYDTAQKYYKRALDIRKNVLGDDHHDTAISYNNIGGIYHSQGDYNMALDFYLNALAIQEKMPGGEQIDTATFNNNIGSVYRSQGEYGKALTHHLKALAIDQKVLGEDHPNTATVYNNIGTVYYYLRDYNMAMKYMKRALQITERELGHDHPFTEFIRENIESVRETMEEKEQL